MKIVDKPWGKEYIFAHNDKYAGKLLYVKAGEKLSKQYHKDKQETLYFLKGLAFVEIGRLNDTTKYKKFDNRYIKDDERVLEIPPRTIHRIEAIKDSVFFEVSTPELDDVIRLEDSYGRVNKEDKF